MENRIQEEFKPRTYLLVILMLLAIGIGGFLLYSGVNKYIDYQKKVQKEEKLEKKKREDEEKKRKEEFEKVSNDIELSGFNGTLEMYSGTETGNQVTHLFDYIITSNNKNKDHIITVSFKGKTSSNSEEIRSYKKELDDWTEYEVITNYDDNGYINKIEVR